MVPEIVLTVIRGERVMRAEGPPEFIIEERAALFANDSHFPLAAFCCATATRRSAQISHGHFDSMVCRCIAPRIPFIARMYRLRSASVSGFNGSGWLMLVCS